jgi:hypothetical protein
MSGILRRTMYYDSQNGCIRPFDWAVAETQLGPMMEPFQPFQRTGKGSPATVTEFDDMCSMVNEVAMFDPNKSKQLLGDTVHGGNLWPRVGK